MASGSARGQIFMDPTDISNLNDETPRFGLGDEVFHAGNMFIYVQHHQGAGVVASADGRAAYWRTMATGIVSPDKTESQQGAGRGLGCAGIYQGVVTHNRYTWLQKRGLRAGVLLLAGDSNGANGNKIFPQVSDVDTGLRSETLVGVSAEEITAQQVGIQIGAGAGDAATVYLTIL